MHLNAAILFVLAGASGADGPVQWRADFERPPHRVQAWASDGQSTVHALEISEAQARSGTRALKLDVTLESGTYHYWYVPTRRLPAVDGMVATGWMYVAHGAAGVRPALGFNVVFDPLPESGCKTLDGPRPVPVGRWVKFTADLGAPSREMVRGVLELDRAPTTVDRLGLMLFGGGGGRVIVYIDDLEIRGRIPSNVEATNAAAVEAAREAFRRYVEGQSKRFVAVHTALAGDLEPSSACPGIQAHARKVNQWRGGLVYKAQQELSAARSASYLAPRRRVGLEAALVKAEALARSLTSLDAYKAGAGQNFVTYVWPAIDDRRIVPMTFPLDAAVSDTLAIVAAPGEYEPATFAIYPHANLSGVTVTPTDLKGPAGTIPADAVDVRWVKCWYQAGVEVWDVRHKTLTPELLLRDDDLVRVDYKKQRQWLRDRKEPKDAETLQPVNLYNEFVKQVWVTVHVPAGTAAGTYEGRLTIGPPGRPMGRMKLRLTVYPFTLPEPCLDYAIYYRGKLSKSGTIGSELKSAAQYEAEMRNLVAHGVTAPTCYTNLLTPGLEEVIGLRRRCGVKVDPLLSLGLSTGAPTTPLGLEVLRKNVAEAVARVNRAGIKTLYIYGIDEASGDRLRAERAAFETVHQAGGKVFVACYRDAFRVVGDRLDLAVFAGEPDPKAARDWHSKGAKIYSYANPQCGVEAPARYRRNYGLALWRAGFDGACDYAYQHAFGRIWDDFDHPRYRDHVMAYPTANGVVDTVQWEGFREAVDDVRYLTALLARIKAARAAGGEPAEKAEKATAWLDALDVRTCDLHAARRTMAEWIIALAPPKKAPDSG